MQINKYFIKYIQYSCLSNFLFYLFLLHTKLVFSMEVNLHFFFNFLKFLNQQKIFIFFLIFEEGHVSPSL